MIAIFRSSETFWTAFRSLHPAVIFLEGSVETQRWRIAAARVVCFIEFFGESGRFEVSARMAAIDWRLQALAGLAGRPEFWNWPMRDGAGKIPANVLEAAAIKPLIERGGEPAFNPESFLERLLAMTEEEGHG